MHSISYYKLVKEQLDSHLESNNIISEFQSAFREKHSGETSLNLVLNKWKQKRAMKRQIVVIFLDFKKAFETVNIGQY